MGPRKKMYLKYGGMQFRNLVKAEEINKHVRKLPAEERDSIFEVAKELQAEGMIEIVPAQQETAGEDSCL